MSVRTGKNVPPLRNGQNFRTKTAFSYISINAPSYSPRGCLVLTVLTVLSVLPLITILEGAHCRVRTGSSDVNTGSSDAGREA